MIRVIVVDDDPLVTQSLKTILEITGEIQVITTGSSAEEAVVAYQANQPDVLLMDIRMGASTGLVAAAEILAKYPAAKILLLTTFSDDEYIQEALRLGVKGYLIKQKLETIVPAIKAVTNGQSVFGTEIVERLTDLLQPSDTRAGQAVYEGLTPREQEVLVKIANGKNNREIAEALFLSEGTVRNYISQLLEKLELRDRTQLAIFYYQQQG